MSSEKKKKRNRTSDAPEQQERGKRTQLGLRIGAALILLTVLAGVVLPLYNPGSPIKKNRKVMTVNGHDVSSDEFEYFLSAEITDFVYYYSASYFADQKYFSDLLEYVTQEITFYYTFLDWAEENGYGLDQEQRDEIKADLERSKDGFETEEQYQEYLDSMYVTEEVLYNTECMFRTLDNYYAYLTDPENGPYAESAKELASDPERFSIYGAKHILFLFGENDRTDEETRALAEDVLAQIRNGGSFDDLMNQYSEDPGLMTYPDGYTFTKGEFVDEFYNATIGLGIGETSDLVESSYGFHIIRRIEPDRDEAAEKIVKNLYGAEIDSRVAAAEVKKSRGFESITYNDFKISKDYPATAEDETADGGSEE